jgi:hypothetical protein
VILRDAAALIVKICVKKIIHGRAQRQKCSVTDAPMQYLAILISHFVMHILPKTGDLLAKTYEIVFGMQNLTQKSVFADLREIQQN